MTVSRAIQWATRAGAGVFWRLFGAPPERQLWGMMVPRERTTLRVGVVIISRVHRADVVTRN